MEKNRRRRTRNGKEKATQTGNDTRADGMKSKRSDRIGEVETVETTSERERARERERTDGIKRDRGRKERESQYRDRERHATPRTEYGGNGKREG